MGMSSAPRTVLLPPSQLVATDRTQTLNPGDYSNTATDSFRAGIRQQIVTPVELRVEFTRRDSDTKGRLSSAGFPSSFTQSRLHSEVTPRLVGTFNIPTGQLLITLGADLFETDYVIKSDFGKTDDKQTQIGIYGQGVIPLTESVDLMIGARHGRVMNDIVVDTAAIGRSLPKGTELDDSANALEGGINYRFNESWRLYAKVDRNFRFVTADEYSAVADNNFFARRA